LRPNSISPPRAVRQVGFADGVALCYFAATRRRPSSCCMFR
jgi:hypothetical protein